MSIIKIPSKKIYDNQKHGLSKNYINKVEAKESVVVLEKDFDALLLTEKIDLTKDVYSKYYPYEKLDWKANKTYGEVDERVEPPSGLLLMYTRYITRVNVYDLKNYPIRIYKKANNNKKTTTKVYGSETKHSLRIKKTIYTQSYEDLIANKEAWTYVSEEFVDSIPSKFSSDDLVRNDDVEFDDYNKMTEEFKETGEGDGAWFYTYLGIRIAADAVLAWAEVDKLTQEVINSRVEKHIYEPQELNISFYGDTEEYKDANNNRSYGDEDGDDYYSIETNELMLDTATINGVPATQAIAENIINGFKNGKETYSLVCSIGDYYDEDGMLAISSNSQINGKNKMMFDIGDTVIPYKPSASGDVVISSSANGTSPKIFKVVGVTPIFDGAVWQKLDLLETNVAEKSVIIDAIEERTETIVQPLQPPWGTYTNTINISVPSNVDFVKINGEKISGVLTIESKKIDDKNNYGAFVSFGDGTLSITTTIQSKNISVVKEPFDNEDGEFSCVFAAIPEREYLFELHMS